MGNFSFKPDTAQRLVAFELDDVEWANGLTKPEVKIGFVSNSSNNIAELVSLKKRSGTSGTAHRSLLTEYCESAPILRTKTEATKARKKLGLDLAEAGFSVNATLTAIHRIYVVELAANPFAGEDRPAVYVGQTTKNPDERIRQHREGTSKKMATTWKLMTGRRQDLEPGDAYLSHSTYNAEVLESAWGRELEARGFRVFGPTGFSARKKKRLS